MCNWLVSNQIGSNRKKVSGSLNRQSVKRLTTFSQTVFICCFSLTPQPTLVNGSPYVPRA